MHFDFVDLRLFVNLANTRNLTRAAERSNLCSSAASARIRNLELSMGSKLLYRHNLGVTLTPQGETFLTHARMLLQQTEVLHADMQEYSLGMKGHVRLFVNPNASATYVPEVLSRYLSTNPRVSIDLQERISHEVVEAIASGVGDVGIISSGLHTGDLEVLPYFRDPVVMVTPLNHPLAARSAIAFEDALDYEFVALPGTRAIDAFLRQPESGPNRRMRIRVLGGSYETVCRMIEAGIGIGVMPASAVRRAAQMIALKVIPLTNEWADSHLRICARSVELLPRCARDLVDLMVNDARANEPRLAQIAS